MNTLNDNIGIMNDDFIGKTEDSIAEGLQSVIPFPVPFCLGLRAMHIPDRAPVVLIRSLQPLTRAPFGARPPPEGEA